MRSIVYPRSRMHDARRIVAARTTTTEQARQALPSRACSPSPALHLPASARRGPCRGPARLAKGVHVRLAAERGADLSNVQPARAPAGRGSPPATTSGGARPRRHGATAWPYGPSDRNTGPAAKKKEEKKEEKGGKDSAAPAVYRSRAEPRGPAPGQPAGRAVHALVGNEAALVKGPRAQGPASAWPERERVRQCRDHYRVRAAVPRCRAGAGC